MNKLILTFFFAALVFVPSSVRLFAADENESLDETVVFNHYMENVAVRNLFREAQWELLNQPEDTYFTRFFFQSREVFGDLFDRLKIAHDQWLESYSLYAQLHMTRIMPGYIEKYDKIDEAVKRTAMAMGFSQEAVENREIYQTNGDMNAFTVSGNNNRIIVVMHTDLIDRLTIPELRGVLAHEMGHIRSLHSVKGVLHALFMKIAMATLTNSTPEETGGQNLQMVKACFGNSETCHHDHGDPFLNNADSESNAETGVSLEEAFYQAMNLPPVVRIQLIKGYLSIVLAALEAENAPTATREYFHAILEHPNLSTLQLNPEQFLFHMNRAMSAISRSQEKSADNYATAYVPNEYFAMGVARLSGLPLQSNSRLAIRERIRVREMLRNQVSRIFERYSPEAIAAANSATHPAIILRFAYILDAPSYPAVLFAYPYNRLLLLEDLLSHSNNDSLVSVTNSLRAELIRFVKKQSLTAQYNANFARLIQYTAANRHWLLSFAQYARNFVQSHRPQNATETKYFNEISNTASRIEAYLDRPNVVLDAVERLLSAEFRKQRDRVLKARIQERLDIVRKLKSIKDLDVLKSVYESVLPVEGTKAARRVVPIEGPLPSHSLQMVQQCIFLMSHLEARAAKSDGK